MPLYFSAKVSILLYENLSIYLYQKMTVQSYSLHVLLPLQNKVKAKSPIYRPLNTAEIVEDVDLDSTKEQSQDE